MLRWSWQLVLYLAENSSCTELLHIIHGVANIPHSGSCISCQKVFFCRKGCPLPWNILKVKWEHYGSWWEMVIKLIKWNKGWVLLGEFQGKIIHIMIDSLILAQNFSLNVEFPLWNYKITMVTEIISGQIECFSCKSPCAITSHKRPLIQNTKMFPVKAL